MQKVVLNMLQNSRVGIKSGMRVRLAGGRKSSRTSVKNQRYLITIKLFSKWGGERHVAKSLNPVVGLRRFSVGEFADIEILRHLTKALMKSGRQTDVVGTPQSVEVQEEEGEEDEDEEETSADASNAPNRRDPSSASRLEHVGILSDVPLTQSILNNLAGTKL